MPESFKVLIKELQSLGLDVRLYSENDEELEIKEHIDEGIDYEEAKLGEDVIAQNELDENYITIDEDNEEILLDVDEEAMDDDELFTELDDDDEMIFDTDLAEDNLENDGLE